MEGGQTPVGTPKALVVAGYTLFAQGLIEILREEGVAVLGAATGVEEGRRALLELRPDVLVVERELIGSLATDAFRLGSLIIGVNRFDNVTWILKDGHSRETMGFLDALQNARAMSGGINLG